MAFAPLGTNGNPLKSLIGLARLDTCVTVVDASNVMKIFEDGRFISEKFENIDKKDERTVVDLLVDQIEFANVIIINKVADALPKELEASKELIKKLNPNAEILLSNYSKVPLKKILDTKIFNYELAATSPGWLQSLREPLIPETEEYGISSFIFKARRPFHPQRIFDFAAKYFCVLEKLSTDKAENDKEEQEDQSGSENNRADVSSNEKDENLLAKRIAQQLEAKQASPLKNIFRSKGFIWIATRPKNKGEWSQAGLMLTIKNGGRWFSEIPASAWPKNPEIRRKIKQDFDREVDDKRQELVFIGQFSGVDKDWIHKSLSKCLLTSKVFISIDSRK